MSYTQAPHLTDKEIDDFLKEAPTAIICSKKYEKFSFLIIEPIFL